MKRSNEAVMEHIQEGNNMQMKREEDFLFPYNEDRNVKNRNGDSDGSDSDGTGSVDSDSSDNGSDDQFDDDKYDDKARNARKPNKSGMISKDDSSDFEDRNPTKLGKPRRNSNVEPSGGKQKGDYPQNTKKSRNDPQNDQSDDDEAMYPNRSNKPRNYNEDSDERNERKARPTTPRKMSKQHTCGDEPCHDEPVTKIEKTSLRMRNGVVDPVKKQRSINTDTKPHKDGCKVKPKDDPDSGDEDDEERPKGRNGAKSPLTPRKNSGIPVRENSEYPLKPRKKSIDEKPKNREEAKSPLRNRKKSADDRRPNDASDDNPKPSLKPRKKSFDDRRPKDDDDEDETESAKPKGDAVGKPNRSKIPRMKGLARNEERATPDADTESDENARGRENKKVRPDEVKNESSTTSDSEGSSDTNEPAQKSQQSLGNKGKGGRKLLDENEDSSDSSTSEPEEVETPKDGAPADMSDRKRNKKVNEREEKPSSTGDGDKSPTKNEDSCCDDDEDCCWLILMKNRKEKGSKECCEGNEKYNGCCFKKLENQLGRPK